MTKDYPYYMVHLSGFAAVLFFDSCGYLADNLGHRVTNGTHRRFVAMLRPYSILQKRIGDLTPLMLSGAISFVLIVSFFAYSPQVSPAVLALGSLQAELSNCEPDIMVLIGFPEDYNTRILAAYLLFDSIEMYVSYDNITISPNLQQFQPWKSVRYPVIFDDWESL